MPKVTVHTATEVDCKDAHVIAAFPSVGLVATIVATYIVEELGLDQLGVMDSDRFPTLSVVENGEPLNPVRIYGRAGGPIVFLSEFQPSPDLVRPVSEAIVTWAKEHGCRSIATPEGLILEGEPGPGEPLGMVGAGSTQAMRDALIGAGVALFEEGIVAGVTGVLLNLGKRDSFPVMAILSEAKQGEPDGRSAAAVVEVLAKVLGTPIDASRLLGEADVFDDRVDHVERRRRLAEGQGDGESLMFG